MKTVTWKQLTKIQQNNILQRKTTDNIENISQQVKDIIKQVKLEKDKALKHYSQKFDNVLLKHLTLNLNAVSEPNINSTVKEAIHTAHNNIKNFHNILKPETKELNYEGLKIWREYKAIEKVGLYIPGGSAPLISTLLMLAIPAQIAGCKEIVVSTPANKNGEIDPNIIYTAKFLGLEKIHKIGGAQAIAAMAYGTESINKVYKIFGPGNKYVTEAKIQVSKDPLGAALDLPAGPSEVLIIADGSTNPKITAIDLLAQAEHDSSSKAILITNNQKLATDVLKELNAQKEKLSRKAILEQSLKDSYIILTEKIDEAFAISNDYAAEHLLLQIENPENYLNLIENAGSVFIGPWSSESLGDYASGTNHVLPTYGYAKNYSGLSVENFMKSISFQKADKIGLINLAQTIETLAELENLEAHKNSITIRKNLINNL